MKEVLYRGQWGLSEEGVFRQDPWFHGWQSRTGLELSDVGFGKPPYRGLPVVRLDAGVVFPGLVNAHTHLEFSWLNEQNRHKNLNGEKMEAGDCQGIFSFVRLLGKTERPPVEQLLQHAQREVQKAVQEGTIFFADICNDAGFLARVPELSGFRGLRFIEALGFSSSVDLARIRAAQAALDLGANPAIHSIYGSSPRIFDWAAGWKPAKGQDDILSLHFLEDPDERLLCQGKGDCADFLRSIGQYESYAELTALDSQNMAEYLTARGLGKHRLLLAHFTAGSRHEAQYIRQNCPQAVWVVCQRSNEFLGYERSDWSVFGQFPFLLGTDSAPMAFDLSILREVLHLAAPERLDPSRIWQAATWAGYRFFNLNPMKLPWFHLQGATREIDSMLSCLNKGLLKRLDQFDLN